MLLQEGVGHYNRWIVYSLPMCCSKYLRLKIYAWQTFYVARNIIPFELKVGASPSYLDDKRRGGFEALFREFV